MKLLLVEDETGLRAALCRSLENEHYDVEQAANGPEGLEHLLTGLYDAAVLDVICRGWMALRFCSVHARPGCAHLC